jgi:RNA polymerase II subunit A C-terminal domain phosphatase SSU72
MTSDPRLARLSNHTASVPSPPPPPPPPPTLTETRPNTNHTLDGSTDEPDNSQSKEDGFKLKFCTVCASNQNRSMEAHMRLAGATYPVISFGTGSLVRLPGPSINQPNVFTFNNTSYAQMLDELMSKDPRLYRNNGVLNMVERNKSLKWGPERFQDWVPGLPRLDHIANEEKGSTGTEGGVVDVIFTCEERCWDAVVDDLLNRGSPLNRPVHVFNVDIRDNHEEASIGGRAILELADKLNQAAAEEIEGKGSAGWENGAGAARQGFDEKVPDILVEWQEKWPNLPTLWTVAWF